MHGLEHASSLECVHNNLLVLTALAIEHKLGNARLIGTNLNTLIYISISVTSDSDRLLPILHCRMDARDGDRSAEYSTVENRTDCAVRALPHLVELIFVHALVVRCDGSTLHSNAKSLCSLGCVLCNLVTSLVALNKTEVVIF